MLIFDVIYYIKNDNVLFSGRGMFYSGLAQKMVGSVVVLALW